LQSSIKFSSRFNLQTPKSFLFAPPVHMFRAFCNCDNPLSKLTRHSTAINDSFASATCKPGQISFHHFLLHHNRCGCQWAQSLSPLFSSSSMAFNTITHVKY
jgi:hypothetical protein